MNYAEQINKQHSAVKEIALSGGTKRVTYVFSDLNVRDPFVTNSKDVMLYDTRTVVQDLWRLLTTEEGEIPNFRQYGLSVKKFCQYPLSPETISAIYDYVKERIEFFETRVEVIRADVDIDVENGLIYFTFYVMMRASGEVITLPTWSVQVSTY